jgi:hypothetical protein
MQTYTFRTACGREITVACDVPTAWRFAAILAHTYATRVHVVRHA